MKTFLKILFAAIFISMICVTTWASFHRGVIPAAADLWNDAWGRATLFDTYFAFLTFFIWVCFKERTAMRRIGWFLGIMLLGNIAISAYMLRELFRMKNGDTLETLLTRRNG